MLIVNFNFNPYSETLKTKFIGLILTPNLIKYPVNG